MKIWFSPQNDCFYLGQWFPEQPQGTIEISASTHAEMMKAQDEGLVISHDADGNPIAILPPVKELTHAELVALAENQRDELLRHADSVTADWRVELMLDDIADADKENLLLWMEYKRKVKSVDTSTVPDIIWPEAPAA